MALAILIYDYLLGLIGGVRVLVPNTAVRLLCPSTGFNLKIGPVAGQIRSRQNYTISESLINNVLKKRSAIIKAQIVEEVFNVNQYNTTPNKSKLKIKVNVF